MPIVQDRWLNKGLCGNRYVVTKKLGEGGMGTVYLAADRNLQTEVVIKTPHPSMLRDPEFAARFTREVRSLVVLSHPHIVKVLDVDQQEDVPFAILQFLPGGSLESRLFGSRAESEHSVWQPPSLADVCGWLTQIAAALDFIHGKGFIHRDVKPANILFDQSNYAYLTDFGVAKVLAHVEASPKPKLTATGMVLGTPEYMAPELLQGKPFDHRIDQYALAVTVFEALSGTRPYDGATPAAVALAQVQQPIPKLHEHAPGISVEVSRVLARALAVSPDDRFVHCEDFLTALQAASEKPLASRGSSRAQRETLASASKGAPRSSSVEAESRFRRGTLVPAPRRVQSGTDNDTARGPSSFPRQSSASVALVRPPLHERLRTNWQAASGRARAAVVGGVLLFLCAISLSLSSRLAPQPSDPLVTNATNPDPSPAGENGNESPPIPKTFEGGRANVEREDNGLKMKFVWCPPGTFTMGSPKDETDRYDDEDQVSVSLSLGFWMGKFEVTQGEWSQVMETSVAQQQEKQNGIDRVSATGDRHPMCFVTHDEATEFCVRLTDQERRSGRLPQGWEYRLPSEAQWEYACRAGTTTATAFGSSLSSTLANFDGSRPYGAVLQGRSSRSTTEVGSYQSNDWGLFDMHGNVYEWSSDRYVKQLPGGRDPDLRQGSGASQPVYRGGSWNFGGKMCRSAHRRFGVVPDFRRSDVGFRVAAVQSAPISTTFDPQSNEPSPITGPVKLPNAPKTPSPGVPPKSVSKVGSSPPPPAVASIKSFEGTRAGEEWDDNGLKMKFCWCPPGTFLMGSPSSELKRGGDEDQVSVTLSCGFWLSRCEVTQGEWQAIMGTTVTEQQRKSNMGGTIGEGVLHPIYCVNFGEVTEFCRKLTESERSAGHITELWEYRLPTEAQWEYACRAGTTTATSFGDQLSSTSANFDGKYPYGQAEIGTSLRRTALVGSYPPNAWGLCDMHGNVEEWVSDSYAEKLPGGRDPQVAAPGKLARRVVRGGPFGTYGYDCRSARRLKRYPPYLRGVVGFRVALVKVPKPEPTTTSMTTPPLKMTLPSAGKEQWQNSIGMKFVLIPKGDFLMGSSEGGTKDKPQHRVQITKSFYMGVYEVTQGEYERVTGDKNSQFSSSDVWKEKVAGQDTSQFPADYVSWFEAVDFCNVMSEREGLTPLYQIPDIWRLDHNRISFADVVVTRGNGYRLPTEAEWEYACRAGTKTAFHFGNSNNGTQANVNGTDPHPSGTARGPNLTRPTTVGSYLPNAFGLYDMHGNVGEWCQDWFDENYYRQFAAQAAVDPQGPASSSSGGRVDRGGAWLHGGWSAMSSNRHGNVPTLYHGFRVVLVRE